MNKLKIFTFISILSVGCLAISWSNTPIQTKLDQIVSSDVVVFKQVRLIEVAKTLSTLSKVKIFVLPELSEMIVDIRLKKNCTLKEALELLKTKHNISYQISSKGILLSYGVVDMDKEDGLFERIVLAEAKPSAAPAQGMLAYKQRSYIPIGGEPEVFSTEEYARIYGNKFLEVISNPLSTFSIDVDTASYSNVRRFVDRGELPPKDAVRIEELINYFHYDYPQAQGDEPFSIHGEISDCPWNNAHRLVKIGVKGKDIDTKDLPPSNLVFLIDVSGSMSDANKLPLLKKAFRLLVNNLRKEDVISMVVYAGAAGVVLDSVSGAEKDKITNALEHLEAGGSTAGGQGIQLAYKIAKQNLMRSGNNRVILATDGDFNIGVSSTGDLTRLIEERRNDGIFLTVLD